MVTFPTPSPANRGAEHPRDTSHINASPSASEIRGKAPIDSAASQRRGGGPGAVTGKQPGGNGYPEIPDSDNTGPNAY